MLSETEESQLREHIRRNFSLLLFPWVRSAKGENQPQTTFLEIGCGDGRYGELCAEQGWNYLGFDVRPLSVGAAQERLRRFPNAKAIVGDGSTLKEVANESVDFVFSYQTLYHVPKAEILSSYLKEIARVLKGDGYAKVQILGGDFGRTKQFIWRPLGSFGFYRRFKSSWARYLPKDLLLPWFRREKVQSSWGQFGALLPEAEALQIARSLDLQAETKPSFYGSWVEGERPGIYWLYLWKKSARPFELTVG